MKGKTEHCGWKSAPQQKPCPCDRYKHACVVCRGFVYLHGGRNMTSLRDFWRYNIAKNEWEMLDCSGDGPEELEEHSMVAYKGNLYIFGGMVDSAFTQAKIPLWTYDTDSTRWTECRNVPAEKESLAPANRKGHSAVVYHSSMYIFGGYFGIKGISQEFWTFHFDTGKWLCVSSPSHNTGPGPRHGHSAVVYRTGMYLFGGLMGLSEQKDLWKWDFVSSSWSNIRTSHWKNDQKGCGQLVPIPRHTRFGNYFRQRPTDRAFGSKESNAIEMKTFSLPLEPVGFRAFQTTSEAELDPNRDTSLLTKDESLPLFPSSERETLAAAQVVGEEEGSDCGCATAGDELGSSTNTLLLIGGKPLSSFAELSFRQMEFDSS
ncbi:PREDICTED: host cell factor 2-like isoform X2 [Lepidothrix coronata]|uniref:Host cell factor 2-like isoform X2 n=1 Tax=Lepidothrix coronata TaxID=321398 RepID=A0A6J0HX37_9PASS|nr:PREDICTED: host cell factor 2-like isoform X2 [Lepidothrix coronata]